MFWKKEKSGAYIKLEEIYIFYSSFGSSGGSTERLPDKDDFKNLSIKEADKFEKRIRKDLARYLKEQNSMEKIRTHEKLNEQIDAYEVKVVDGRQSPHPTIGIMKTTEALELAKSEGVDLLEVNTNVYPSICQLIKYKPWKYFEEEIEKHEMFLDIFMLNRPKNSP